MKGDTIAWCIEKKTKLRQAIRDLANWADELVVDPSAEAIELGCLSTSMNIFVEEMQKVVGYMTFIIDDFQKSKCASRIEQPFLWELLIK